MDVPKTEVFSVLQEFNPWWVGTPLSDLPNWTRFAGEQVWQWLQDAETRRRS
jgi:hypothetical protein